MILERGFNGTGVTQLQAQLKRLGFYEGLIDGAFGPQTEQAVIDFQEKTNIGVDGKVGPQTKATLNDYDQGRTFEDRTLTRDDYERVAEQLGSEFAMVRAFSRVESRGSGFLSDGRPKILFERHWMYRFLERSGAVMSNYKAVADVVNSSPGGYVGGVSEYKRLNKAKGYNADMAVQSTSYGAFQIMGFHWERLGFDSPTHFEKQMGVSEGTQLEAVAAFILSDSDLHKAILDKEWNDIARIYNGPSYAKGKYHTKLKAAYEYFLNTKQG